MKRSRSSNERTEAGARPKPTTMAPPLLTQREASEKGMFVCDFALPVSKNTAEYVYERETELEKERMSKRNSVV